MIKLLIGGSPCTYWSIAQKNNRETEPSGLGWELFENYLIAKEKFKPDFFLYENNVSASKAIKDEIKKRLNVWDETLLMADTGSRYIEINSALVSAQNRKRFYVHNCGEVCQPEDRLIFLKEILESGEQFGGDGKSYCLVGTYYKGQLPEKVLKMHERTMVAEHARIPEYSSEKSRPINASYSNKGISEGSIAIDCFPDNPSKQVFDYVAEPIRIGDFPNSNGEISGSQATRICSSQGKSVNIVSNGGGQGAKTGLYAIPYYELSEEYYKGTDTIVGMTTNGEGKYRNGSQPSQQYRVYNCEGKPQVVNTLANENYIGPYKGKKYPVYEVKNGQISIKGKWYPIRLSDGHYIIRKLTPVECERLQTLPDNYTAAVSDSQRYKGLGNGWTAEVIIHILSNALKDIPRDEKIIVLSMYDGIGTGRYCLDKMGFTNVEYHAYEIDKYAIKVAMSNYPDIILHGDAFQVRKADWSIYANNK